MTLRLLHGWAGLGLSAGWLEWLMHKKLSAAYVLQSDHNRVSPASEEQQWPY